MNNVYILLDRSGSMDTLWDEAVGSINGYVATLPVSTKVTVAVFDSIGYDIIRNGNPLNKGWKDISPKEASPRGGTPLYDSTARMINQAMYENPERAVLVVMTDGYENSSKEYSRSAVKAKVDAFKARGWEVIFLGADFDVREQASDFGIGIGKTMNYEPGSFLEGMRSLGAATTAYVTGGTAINLVDTSSSLGGKFQTDKYSTSPFPGVFNQ